MTHEQLNIEYLLKCKGWTKNKQGRLVDPHGQVRPKGMIPDYTASVTERGLMLDAIIADCSFTTLSRNEDNDKFTVGGFPSGNTLNKALIQACIALKVKVK